MNLNQKIKNNIQSEHLFHRGDTVIVGVSGGSDSVALLHLLYDLRHELGITLHVAHYNHNLRRSAKTDQRFVEGLAQKLSLPYHTAIWNHPPSQSSKGSLEELARNQRLKFFSNLVKKNPSWKIALAHTQDDLAETVLMRILRGTGLQGLRSILPQTTLNGLTVIRPLLEISKNEILDYLKKHHLKFRQDPMNKDVNFFRNKIRLQLLPLLTKEYNPNIQEVLANLSKTMTVDYQYLRQEAEKQFHFLARSSTVKKIEFDLKKFQSSHPALQRMMIRLAIERLQGNTNQFTLMHIQKIQKLIETKHPMPTTLSLPKGIHCQRKEKRLIFSLAHDNFKGL